MVMKITAAELGLLWREQARVNKFDYVVAIDGRKSSGKTTLGCWLAYYYWNDWSTQNIEQNFTELVRNKIVYTAILEKQLEEIKKKYRELPRYDAFVVDEAKEFFKMEWQKEGVRRLVKLLGEVRKIINQTGENVGNKMLIMCQDNFLDFPRGLRDGFNVWIRVITRGVGAVFMPDPTPSHDKWHIDSIDKEKRNFLKHTKLYHLLDFNRQLRFYSKFPTFVGIVTFPPMPPNAEKIYLELDGLAKIDKYANDDEFLSVKEKKNKILFETTLEFLKSQNIPFRALSEFMKEKGITIKELTLKKRANSSNNF